MSATAVLDRELTRVNRAAGMLNRIVTLKKGTRQDLAQVIQYLEEAAKALKEV